MPSAPLVPPNPNGDTGSTSVSDATRCAPGRSTRYCSTTPPPMLQPTRCTRSRPRASMAAARSSEKSRTPRVASTGSSSVSPKPRRSMASGRKVSGRASIIGCQNSEDDTLPCTNSTFWPVVRPVGERTLTVRRLVGTRSAVMPGSSLSMVLPQVWLGQGTKRSCGVSGRSGPWRTRGPWPAGPRTPAPPLPGRRVARRRRRGPGTATARPTFWPRPVRAG